MKYMRAKAKANANRHIMCFQEEEMDEKQ